MALIGPLDTGVGFKASTTNYADSFSDVLERSTSGTGNNDADTMTTQIGVGASVASVTANFNEGTLDTTGGRHGPGDHRQRLLQRARPDKQHQLRGPRG